MKKQLFITLLMALFIAVEEMAADVNSGGSNLSGLVTEAPEKSQENDDRKSSTFEAYFSAGSFDYIKESGHYGASINFFPWEICNKFYAGIHLTFLDFNYGLSDNNFTEFKIGPAFQLCLSQSVFIAMPVNLVISTDFEHSVGWGANIAPAIYFGKKGGIFAGPQFTFGFSEGSKAQTGFRAGIFF